MSATILNYILILGALQGFMLSVVIFRKGKSHIAYKYLSAFLLVISLGCLTDNNLGILDINLFMILWAGNSFLLAPLLYLFTNHLILDDKNFNRKSVYHFIPFVVFKILILLLHFNEVQTSEVILVAGAILNFGLIAYNLLYIIKIFGLFKLVKNSKSNRKLSLIKVLFWVFTGYNALFFLRRIIEYFFTLEMKFFENYLYLGAALFMYYVSYKLINQPDVLVEKSKYSKSSIALEEVTSYGKKIEEFFAEKDDYLNSDFKIQDLAESLDINKHKLSQVIGKHFGVNFYDLLHQYRIQHVCQLLLKEEYLKMSIFGIALECGYNSKSAFNAAFKKVKGETPTQYLKKLKEK